MSQVLDPRFNDIAVTLAYLLPGNLPSSRTVMLSVQNGEGECWFDPAQMPAPGAITQGTLVFASDGTFTAAPTFPRYAPLTIRITGADLCFHVRQGQLVNFALVDGDETLVRFYCTGPWTAALSYRVTWPSHNQSQLELIVTRVNALDMDDVSGRPRETTLELYRLKGSITGLPGLFRKQPNSDVVSSDKVLLKRANDGELIVQLHGARMEWDFANSLLRVIRLYSGQGALASLRLPALAGSGTGVSAAFAATIS